MKQFSDSIIVMLKDQVKQVVTGACVDSEGTLLIKRLNRTKFNIIKVSNLYRFLEVGGYMFNFEDVVFEAGFEGIKEVRKFLKSVGHVGGVEFASDMDSGYYMVLQSLPFYRGDRGRVFEGDLLIQSMKNSGKDYFLVNKGEESGLCRVQPQFLIENYYGCPKPAVRYTVDGDTVTHQITPYQDSFVDVTVQYSQREVLLLEARLHPYLNKALETQPVVIPELREEFRFTGVIQGSLRGEPGEFRIALNRNWLPQWNGCVFFFKAEDPKPDQEHEIFEGELIVSMEAVQCTQDQETLKKYKKMLRELEEFETANNLISAASFGRGYNTTCVRKDYHERKYVLHNILGDTKEIPHVSQSDHLSSKQLAIIALMVEMGADLRDFYAVCKLMRI